MMKAADGHAATSRRTQPAVRVGLGIDVGGTGVKAAMVDLETAELVTPRIRQKTPHPSTPDAVLETIDSVTKRVLAEHSTVRDLPIGCGLPGAIKFGVMKTAANLDKDWIDYDAGRYISAILCSPVHVINDADAAAVAELAFGVAKGRPGTIILLTVGTGIGSALISEGRLVPNSEFGHLEMRGKEAEKRVSAAARTRRGMSWKRWAAEFNEYLAMLDLLFWPDTIILGGGLSKESKKYEKYLVSRAELVNARFLNTSGIIGAAYAASLAASEAADAGPSAGGARAKAAAGTVGSKKRG